MEPNLQSTNTYTDVACTMCGCVCDDLTITVDGEHVTEMTPGCPLAERWLLNQTAADVPSARINGQVVSHNEAVEHAAKILRSSRSPLIYGLSRSSTPGQRAACRLADRIGAYIDTTASTCHAPSIIALQSVGESTSTLGEIRNRSDLIVYWGSNPLESHPRHVERYVDAPGMFVPGGRDGRHVVVVDVEPTSTSEIADTFVHVQRGQDFDLIWALRAIVKGISIQESHVAGVSRDELHRLANLFTSCRYGAVFFGLGLTKDGVAHANVEALLRLVTDLNAHTRFVARRMRIPGDVAGADTVLCWQTGFPFSVSLSRGYPRYNPGEYTANNLLERGEVDAVLLVGSEGIDKLSARAQSFLQRTETIVLDYPTVSNLVPANVHFTTAVYGVHRQGTVYRMDEVPIALRKFIDSPLLADHEILQAIADKITQ
jgi:formylmethanofuran dehydrogenase subunit B